MAIIITIAVLYKYNNKFFNFQIIWEQKYLKILSD